MTHTTENSKEVLAEKWIVVFAYSGSNRREFFEKEFLLMDGDDIESKISDYEKSQNIGEAKSDRIRYYSKYKVGGEIFYSIRTSEYKDYIKIFIAETEICEIKTNKEKFTFIAQEIGLMIQAVNERQKLIDSNRELLEALEGMLNYYPRSLGDKPIKAAVNAKTAINNAKNLLP